MPDTNITQADRASYLALNMVSPQDKAAILSGDWDATHGMQVLAAHRIAARIAALEEAARVAEAIGTRRNVQERVFAIENANTIATAIRNLTTQDVIHNSSERSA